MSAPPPPNPGPGWYPDPSGAQTQRYFDGGKWTERLAPFNTPPPQQPRQTPAKSPRTFVILLVGSVVASFVAFILMQLAFSAAADGSGSLIFEIVGFALFIVWLASVVGFLVGITGTIVRLVQR